MPKGRDCATNYSKELVAAFHALKLSWTCQKCFSLDFCTTLNDHFKFYDSKHTICQKLAYPIYFFKDSYSLFLLGAQDGRHIVSSVHFSCPTTLWNEPGWKRESNLAVMGFVCLFVLYIALTLSIFFFNNYFPISCLNTTNYKGQYILMLIFL